MNKKQKSLLITAAVAVLVGFFWGGGNVKETLLAWGTVGIITGILFFVLFDYKEAQTTQLPGKDKKEETGKVQTAEKGEKDMRTRRREPIDSSKKWLADLRRFAVERVDENKQLKQEIQKLEARNERLRQDLKDSTTTLNKMSNVSDRYKARYDKLIALLKSDEAGKKILQKVEK